MIYLISLTLIFEKDFGKEVSQYSLFFKNRIILNFSKGGSYTLNFKGKVLSKDRTWLVPYRGELYEFEGGAQGTCSSVFKLSPNSRYLMYITGCTKEGFEAGVYGTDVSVYGTMLEADLTNESAFILSDGVLNIYDLETGKLIRKYEDFSEFAVGNMVCDEYGCLVADLLGSVHLFDTKGNRIWKKGMEDWEGSTALALSNKYALIGFIHARDGVRISLLDRKTGKFVWTKDFMYVEGYRTACITSYGVIVTNSESIYHIDFKGQTVDIRNFPNMWVVCKGKYVLSGDRKVGLFSIR